MGTLIGPDEQIVSLGSQHKIGRQAGNDLVLLEKDVSKIHAEICWTADGWVLIDRSTNGSFINQRKIRQGVAEPLVEGMVIKFASSRWVMHDDMPPVPMARTSRGRLVVGTRDLLLLPSPQEALASVAMTVNGWVLERPGDVTSSLAMHGDEVTVDGEQWTLELPIEAAVTVDNPEMLMVADLTLQISHSVDMEHIVLIVTAGQQPLTLPARAHNQTLFTLASLRLRDRAAGVAEPEAGWRTRTQLAQLANVGQNTLDQHVFRARQQLIGLELVFDGSNLIERRDGRVRIGISKLTIEPLGA